MGTRYHFSDTGYHGRKVPDTALERMLRPADGTLDRQSLDGLINELDEYAIEEGLKVAEAHGGEVTIVSMGPRKAAESIPQGTGDGGEQGRAPVRRCAGRRRRGRDVTGSVRGVAAHRVRPGDLRVGREL
jgi:hypothetical protein